MGAWVNGWFVGQSATDEAPRVHLIYSMPSGKPLGNLPNIGQARADRIELCPLAPLGLRSNRRACLHLFMRLGLSESTTRLYQRGPNFPLRAEIRLIVSERKLLVLDDLDRF